MRGEGPHAGGIIGDAIGGILVGADIDADHPAAAGARGEPCQHGLVALVVEAQPVDDGTVAHQPENARTRISRLRQGRHRADLGETETEAQKRVRHIAVLVEPGGHAERIGKADAGDRHPQPRVGLGRAAQRQAGFEPPDRKLVGALCLKGEEQLAPDGLEHRHGAISGKTCRPSAPSGSFSTRRTAESGSGP